MIHDILLILTGVIICLYLKIFDKLMPPVFLKFLSDINFGMHNYIDRHDKELMIKHARIEHHLNNIFREANRVGALNKNILKSECIILKNLYLDK